MASDKPFGIEFLEEPQRYVVPVLGEADGAYNEVCCGTNVYMSVLSSGSDQMSYVNYCVNYVDNPCS